MLLIQPCLEGFWLTLRNDHLRSNGLSALHNLQVHRGVGEYDCQRSSSTSYLCLYKELSKWLVNETKHYQQRSKSNLARHTGTVHHCLRLPRRNRRWIFICENKTNYKAKKMSDVLIYMLLRNRRKPYTKNDRIVCPISYVNGLRIRIVARRVSKSDHRDWWLITKGMDFWVSLHPSMRQHRKALLPLYIITRIIQRWLVPGCKTYVQIDTKRRVLDTNCKWSLQDSERLSNWGPKDAVWKRMKALKCSTSKRPAGTCRDGCFGSTSEDFSQILDCIGSDRSF